MFNNEEDEDLYFDIHDLKLVFFLFGLMTGSGLLFVWKLHKGFIILAQVFFVPLMVIIFSMPHYNYIYFLTNPRWVEIKLIKVMGRDTASVAMAFLK